MTPAALQQATLDLLTGIESSARPADAVTSAYIRANRQLDDKARGAVLEQVYSLLRHRARLGWWVTRHGHDDTPRNRLLASLVIVDGKTPDQVRRLFDGSRGGPTPLTAGEDALLATLRPRAVHHSDMPQTVRLECPDWAHPHLQHRFGQALADEMDATLAPPPLDLRVNPARLTREAALRDLRRAGLDAVPTPLSPLGLRLPGKVPLARLAGLKTGDLEIQDEGSQLVALLVDPRPGERVVDFCAGAGGKTLALAAQMQNKGHVIACDINEARLKRCAERHRRAGLHNVETRLLSSETDRWVKRHKGGFDRVLVDAPCTGTGTWRRNPDARWRAPDLGLKALLALQTRILASAARLVKPGGRLVYATCSVLVEENEQQVAAFLAASPGFGIVPLQEAAPHLSGVAQSGFLSLTPARHGTDGFFAAVLRRETGPTPS